MDDTTGLTQLGSKQTEYQTSGPSADILETFLNKFPGRNYIITHTFPEFTSLCPKTGQPDFAHIEVRYIAAEKCVETKSLKLYFFAFRNEGAFMESNTNRILEDLVNVCSPRWMQVEAEFSPRGGIQTTVVAEHGER